MRFSVVAVSIFAGAAMAATSTEYVTEEVTITSCAATVTNCPARSTQVSTTVYPKTSSTESALGSSVTPASKPSSAVPASSPPASSAPASSAPASSAPASSAPASSAPASSAPATSVLVPVASSPASHPGSSAPASSAPASSAPASSNPAPPAVSSTKPVNTFTPIYATPSTSSLGVATTPATGVSVVAITTCIPTVIYSTITLSGHESTAPGVPASSAKPSSTGYITVPANGTTPSATATPMAFTGAASNVQTGGAAMAAIFGLVAFLL